MSTEIIVYLILAAVLSSIRRIISGAKNGAFYGKTNNPNGCLKKSIANLHYLETPAWYTQFGFQFFLCLAVFRLVFPNSSFESISMSILQAMLMTLGSSSMASWHFQGYINCGSGLPWEDPNENKKSEFVMGKVSFWWYRPWYYKRRRFAIVWGIVLIAASICISYFRQF
jgi:hypothetical protein